MTCYIIHPFLRPSCTSVSTLKQHHNPLPVATLIVTTNSLHQLLPRSSLLPRHTDPCRGRSTWVHLQTLYILDTNLRLIDEGSYNKLANRACLFYYATDDVHGFESAGAPTLH
ncbi:hypothetical protein KCU61_g114, partial [Aureobasidium melanogenum]